MQWCGEIHAVSLKSISAVGSNNPHYVEKHFTAVTRQIPSIDKSMYRLNVFSKAAS
jgi:hypothetical protein